MGVPFMPVAGHVGSDYERLRPDFKVVADPYHPGQRVMLVPPITPDVSIVHAHLADRAGTLLLEEREDDSLLAEASRVVVASAERIVPTEELRRSPTGVTLPGIHVTAVVEVPRGAHPTAVRGVYPVDEAHLLRYMALARGDARFKTYLDRFVLGTASHAAYLAEVERP
jgi:glutaconate CoA-transferase subunit A